MGEILAAIDGDTAAALAENLIRSMLDAMEQPPKELQQSLGERYPEINSNVLQELPTRRIFVSEMRGRLNAGSS